MDIAGARILVTGGARGLGRTFALDLASAGAAVGACDTDAEGLAELSSDAVQTG